MLTYSRKNNLKLIICALLRFLIKGGAKKKVIPPNRIILMFLTKNIGDMIFSTPVFRALKKQYPKCYLTVVGVAKNKIILEGNPDIDEYIICPDNINDLIKAIKDNKANYGASFVPSVVDVGVMYLAGIPSIGSFVIKNAKAHTRGYSLLLPLFINIPYFIGKYVAQEYLKLLEPLGVKSTVTKKNLYFNESGKKSVETFFEKENFDPKKEELIIFSPGAGTKIKQWPAERFAQIADYVYEKYNMRVAVIGGPGDREETELFTKSIKKVKPLVFVDSTLDELKAFISYGKILVANDSGPVYIAEAFDVATLVVVGPTDENEHPPIGEKNRIVTCEDRGEAELKGHLEIFDERNARMQIEKVEVSQVIKELENLFRVIRTEKK